MSPTAGLEKKNQIDFGGIRTPDPSFLSKIAIPTTLPGLWERFYLHSIAIFDISLCGSSCRYYSHFF